MKKFFLPLIITLLAVGCTGEKTGAGNGAVASRSVPARTDSASSCPDESTYSPLPPGLTSSIPFHVRSDHIAVSKKGTTKRRVVLELLKGTSASGFDEMKRNLLASGYKFSGNLKGKPDAKQFQRFTKSGSPAVYLGSYASIGKKLANPAAVGLVSLEWKV